MWDQSGASFAEQLKEHRLAAGLTQEALAERAGISARNIQNLERGANRPLADTARRLAAALGLEERARALLLAAVTATPRRRVTAEPAASPVEAEAPLPVGMLAVLVADVRGYTAFTHTHGDEAGAVLAARFAAVAAEAVATEGGQVVEVRGDETLAVFGSARAALRAAVRILTRCAEQVTPELPLRAGVGVDVGEPVAVPGGYRGEVINTAARLCAQAGPGEVLASGATVSLARRVEGLAYRERGALALKGLPHPISAWLVAAGEQGSTFDGSVGTIGSEALRHNLPTAISSFIGREHEQARVGELLATNRLVTLVGAGGVGKTRLAVAVAERALAAYPDGVWLVELASLADPAMVAAAAARALGLRDEPGRPVLETLTTHLAAKRLLLVLDNCEHLVAACASLVTDLLRNCPALRLLATSREALGVAGERRYRVPSLTVPDAAHLPPSELAGSYEAVRLFVDRAQERRPDFALNARNAQAVAEICARLDGVPLAIELAAARAGSMAPEAIAARLDDRFRLLSGGPRDLPSRQRTLRATLDWSWDLLDEPERALLGRLSVFAGGWTLEAAEQVCAGQGLESWAVLDALEGLVNRSLAQVDETGEGGARYRLLETVRQYAGEALAAAGTAAMARDSHLAWCRSLAEEAEPHLTGAAQGAWLARLDAEHDNVREALRWATAGEGDPALGLDLAGTIWRYWDMHGHPREGRAWLERVIARSVDEPSASRARAFRAVGHLAWNQGEYEDARAALDASLRLYQDLGDSEGSALARNGLGLVAWRQADYPRAIACFEENVRYFRERGDAQRLAGALANLGVIARAQGDLERAVTLYEESLALRRAIGDTWGIAAALGNLGNLALDQGDLARTTRCYEESLALFRALRDAACVARALQNLAMAIHAQGEHARAAALLRECMALYNDLGDRVGLVELLDDMARVYGAQHQTETAAQLLGASDAYRAAVGIPLQPNNQARIAMLAGELRAALGEARFAALRSAGTAMTIEQTIALACAPAPEQGDRSNG